MKRILVVDDDPDIRVLEEKILKREGYQVITASNGKAAIEAIKTEEFDLVLLDIMMPGIDGFEVSRFFRRELECKNMPVVFVTAKDDADSMREGFRSGGTVFLSKPFTANQLMRVVNSIIKG
ncbi:MAG: response regulator [Deltaproteobacteria bacterium]|nr:response regulator [Deltaproteobacteria bacterium]MBW1871687.1 response regulator [Deltaproteobacteria bacterium]